MFSTFGSLRQALLVLMNIPFALIGGVFGLLLTREYLSVPASVGFIALLGIAVLNGVVMVTYFNQLRAVGGLPLREIAQRGAERRLRPVLMTAMSTAFGLLPLLLTTGPGSEIQRPLAVVVIGGTSLAGGRGSIIGTVIGALIIAILTNILGLRNVDANQQLMLKAVIIVLAVALQHRRAAG